MALRKWLPRPDSPPRSNRPTDPRLSYDGPFLNVRPDVKYVGDTACTPCHDDRCQQFHQHPMGRSIVPVADWLAARGNRPEPHNPFDALNTHFEVVRQGGRVQHGQVHRGKDGKLLASGSTEVQYVIGSGGRGHSFFAARGGFLFQSPISWFSQEGRWDISPGFTTASLRPINVECLFCHSGGARPVPGTQNRYEEPIFTSAAITCERCHGPAEVHVRERKDRLDVKLPDYTIVNPKRLPAELREDVCHQCHLDGEVRVPRRSREAFDYRPGLPLYDFLAVYVSAPELRGVEKAIGHVVQLSESKCYVRSRGEMGCATCHDPPERLLPEKRVDHYRSKCLDCHGKNNHPCTLDRNERLKQSEKDSCIDCHMPRVGKTDIAHTATVNHRIPLRRPREEVKEPAVSLIGLPLVSFHQARRGEDEDSERDLGMALVMASRTKPAVFRSSIPRALVMLEHARERDPRDLAMLDEMAAAHMLLGYHDKALAVYQSMLDIAPDSPDLLFKVGQAHSLLGQHAQAIRYLEQARAREPLNAVVHHILALSLVNSGDVAKAEMVCKDWLAFDPGNSEGWALLAHAQRRQKKLEEAARSQAAAEATRPTPPAGKPDKP